MSSILNPSTKHILFYPLILLVALSILTGCTSKVDQAPSPKTEENIHLPSTTAQVAVLGIFHFGGSTGDLASMHMANPFGTRRQDEVKELVAQLASFKPSKVLVEYPKHAQKKLQERYRKYLEGVDTLRVSETYQVGFRLAQQLGHDQVYAIDYSINLPGDGLVEYCQRHDKMSEFEAFIKGIQDHVANDNTYLDTMRIAAYLARTNTDSVDRITNQAYIGHALSWGDSVSEAGAKFAATWWERNFVIVKNIAETIESKEDRILVIIGGGHRAVIKDVIIDRSDMEYVEIGTYLN